MVRRSQRSAMRRSHRGGSGTWSVKISGACGLSHEPYGLNSDIREPLSHFDAYGLGRYLRGADRVSDSDRATPMGETLAQVCKWMPGVAASPLLKCSTDKGSRGNHPQRLQEYLQTTQRHPNGS